MKKIKIFLASSITDLKFDRLEVGDFIRQLNDIYFDRGVQFSLIKCDDYDNSIAADGKQSEFDREIRDSELCFFLFFRKVGDYTRHEFEVALDAFRKTQKPRIVTYFKYIDSPDEATADVKSFMQMLDSEVRHYYNIYQSIDTLKLGMLMQIKMMGLDAEEPKVENGRVTFGGMTIAKTEELPVFAGNQTLSALKDRLQGVTEEYYSLREQYRNDFDNDELHLAYSKVALEKSELEKQLRDEEERVLEATKRMSENTAKGTLSPRQAAAYRAFERGDYAGALEILDLDAIMADLSHNEKMAGGYADSLQINVNELMQRVDVLKALGVHAAEAEEIVSLYQKAYETISNFPKLDKTPLYDFACFLDEQNDRERAIEVARQLDYYYSDPHAPASDEAKAALWNLLGLLYGNTQRFAEAEEMLLKALRLRERLARKDPEAFEFGLAKTHNNLGGLYYDTKRFAEAEISFRKALAIRERLAKKDPSAYESYLAASYDNLGALYDAMNRFAEAEASSRKAFALYERLAKRDPKAYEPDLSMCYDNFGVLLYHSGRFEEAEEAYRKGLAIRERLAKDNPAAFEPDLAMSYSNLGAVCTDMGHFEEAEEAHGKALEIRLRLAKNDPSFEPDLAASYNNLGVLYNDTERFAEAEEAYRKSIAIRERLAEENPEAFEYDLAISYANLAALCGGAGRREEGIAAYRKSIEIFERLAEENPEVFEPDLAKNYSDLGDLYRNAGRGEEAKAPYEKSLEIFERLAGEDPETFDPDLVWGYVSCGLLCEDSDPAAAREWYRKAYELAVKHPQNEYCANVAETLKGVLFGD